MKIFRFIGFLACKLADFAGGIIDSIEAAFRAGRKLASQ